MRLNCTVLAAMALGLSLAGAAPSQAVIIAGNGAHHATAPTDDPGFDRVGRVGSGTGVYLGGGWVLTAHHVGGLNQFTVDGTTYTAVTGTATRLTHPSGGASDLAMLQINVGADTPLAGLGLLDIALTGPTADDLGMLIGTGMIHQEWGLPETWYVATTDPESGKPWTWSRTGDLPNVNATAKGYTWSDTRAKRWANAHISDVDLEVDTTHGTVLGFLSTFDVDSTGSGNAAKHDSGSPLFIKRDGQWWLTGIAHATLGYPDQPTDVTVDGNATLYSDLSLYRPQILALIPEPGSLLLLVGGGLTLLGRRGRA